MENRRNNQRQASVSRGSVMDVQLRRPPQPTGHGTEIDPTIHNPEVQVVSPVSTKPPSSTESLITEHEQSSTDNSVAPVNPTVIESNSPEQPKTGLSPRLIAQAEQETKQQEEARQALLAARKAHTNRGPIIASAIAILVAVTLAGIAVYAYKSQGATDTNKVDTSQQPVNRQNSAKTHEAAHPASSYELDTLTKELDSTISATDESQAIPGDSLNENLVGL